MPDALSLVRPFFGQFGKASTTVIGEIEAGSNGAAQQSQLAIANEPRALPDAGGDDELDMLTGI